MSIFFTNTTTSPNVLVIPSETKFSLLPPPPPFYGVKPVIAITGNGTDLIKPIFTIPLDPALDLNRDPEVHQTVTNSIYRQVFQDWLYTSDFEEVYRYIKIVGGQARLVSGSERDTKTDSISIDKKIRFIKDYVISHSRVRKLLDEFVEGTRSNWYDIEKNVFFVKELILKYMKKKLKALAEEKKRIHG